MTHTPNVNKAAVIFNKCVLVASSRIVTSHRLRNALLESSFDLLGGITDRNHHRLLTSALTHHRY